MDALAGGYFVTRSQPPLSEEERDTVRRFNELYYGLGLRGADTVALSWFGCELLKSPTGLWIYQELLARTRPDFVVETGTYLGGSALFLAMMCDLLGHGQVITIDIDDTPARPQHPRISYVHGSSTDPAIVEAVKSRARGRVMVILDSDHHEAHVSGELLAYSDIVRPGDYLIVEDTNINGHPVLPEFGPGPMEAVQRFLARNSDFEVDATCERFLLTLHPRGYLRRK